MGHFIQKLTGWKFLGAILSGVLLAMCFPGYDVSGLVWVWAIPLMACLWSLKPKKLKRKAFGIAYLCGVTFWLINLWWLVSMRELNGVPALGAYFSWIGMSLYLATYVGIWGVFVATIGNPWAKKVKKSEAEKPSKNRVEEAIERKLAVQDSRSSVALGGKKKITLMNGFGTSLRVIRCAVLHASLWVILEWVRGHVFTGFTWNTVGVAFYDTAPIAQAADLVGVLGLSFLPILVASMLTQLGARLYHETKNADFKAHWEIAFTIGLVVMTFMYGINRINHFTTVETHEVRAMILQQNISQNIEWSDEKQHLANYERYSELLSEGLTALETRNAEMAKEKLKARIEGQSEVAFDLLELDIVVMPETALTQNMYYIENFDKIYLSLYDGDFLKRGLLGKGNFSVIYGSNLFEAELKGDDVWPVEGGTNYNSIAIAPPSLKSEEHQITEKISAYGKIHLVPFGEYFPDIPFRDSIYEAMYGTNPSYSFSPGTSYEPLKVMARGKAIDVIPAVCYEDTVGRVTRKFVRADMPQMIVNSTNDGWFGTSVASRQHMMNAKFRTIELRRPMVRAGNTGMSGVIDVTGSFIDQVSNERQIIEDETGNLFVEQSLFAYVRVPLKGELTLYAAFGDWFVVLCGMLSVSMIVFIKLKPNRVD